MQQWAGQVVTAVPRDCSHSPIVFDLSFVRPVGLHRPWQVLWLAPMWSTRPVPGVRGSILRTPLFPVRILWPVWRMPDAGLTCALART